MSVPLFSLMISDRSSSSHILRISLDELSCTHISAHEKKTQNFNFDLCNQQ